MRPGILERLKSWGRRVFHPDVIEYTANIVAILTAIVGIVFFAVSVAKAVAPPEAAQAVEKSTEQDDSE